MAVRSAPQKRSPCHREPGAHDKAKSEPPRQACGPHHHCKTRSESHGSNIPRSGCVRSAVRELRFAIRS
eukprot:452267-Alexandrium_andersonii.AAC.1